MAVGSNIIQVKRSSTSGRTPNTTNSSNSQYINAGELALNMTDKILYTSDGTNLIVVGSNTTNLNATGNLTVVNVYSTGTINAVAYNTGTYGNTTTGGSTVNTTVFAVGNSSVNSIINSTAFTGAANNASYLGGVAAASYVQNTDSRTLSGNLNFTGTNTYFSGKATHNANLVLNPGISVIDSTGSQGTVGQVLVSNGAGNVYWSTVTPSIPATYVQNTDSRTLSGNLNFTGANNTFGTMFTVGAVPGAAANSVSANTTAVLIGNSSVSATVNSTVFSGTASTANNASYLGGTIASGYQTTAGLSANVATLTANAAGYLGTIAAASYVQNTDSRTLSGNITFSSATASPNAIAGAIVIYGGIGANGNVYTAGRIGYANSAGANQAYTYYNTTTSSLDTVFG